MSRVLLLITTSLIVESAWSACQDGVVFDNEKNIAVERLAKRKQGFDQYLANEKNRDKKRLSDVVDQKTIRKNYATQLEKARTSFKRENTEFPMAAYKKFVKARDEKLAKNEDARHCYRKMQQELREVYQDKKYRISGKKEFKL